MNKRNFIIYGTTLIFSLISATINAQPMSIEQCQNIKNQIDYYTDLRRRGGTSYEMEAWKKYRREAKRQFENNDCKKWKKKIK